MHSEDPVAERLKVLLERVARRAEASVGAVFVPRGTGLALAVQFGIDQVTLDTAQKGWANHQKELHAGRVVRYGQAALWPVFDGPQIAAVVYLDQVKPEFPDDRSREDGALLAARAARWGKASPLNGYLRAGYRPADVIAQLERDELAVLFQAFRGNVTAVARELRVCRDTVYDRADRLGLNIDAFRPRRPRRLRRA